jgi:hypothetical protein
LWLSYLAGAHLSIMNIGEVEGEGALAFGAHAELGVSWLLGARGQHELRMTLPALNIYLPAAGGTGIDPAAVFLDQPGATWTLTLGYTHRFADVFGAVPLFTLE